MKERRKKERKKEGRKKKERKKERKKEGRKKREKERNNDGSNIQHVFLPESLQIVELQVPLLTTEWMAVVFQQPEF
jgi:hypothetical protein